MLGRMIRIGLLAWGILLVVMWAGEVRGQLALAEYSTAHPLKIMCVGDSITDDCEYNGAWRQYLEPLLRTNGYIFTFVGRQASAPTTGFAEVHHEGYCGAVIAPPGLLSGPVHGYAGDEVDLQTIVADALTNVTPDLVLLFIGANDIGRGRNPWTVATNDMPQLLDLIFSNAPGATVILGKIGTMQNALVSGYQYGTNAGRVPIYNAALQGMVNQRQAAGQNVFLADMFSVLDYYTMFNGDHLHPNTLGLQTMAGEWLTRIQAITQGGGAVTSMLVKGGERWSYFDGGIDLGTNWVAAGYDDSGWSNGLARLGYGDQESVTKVSYGGVATNKYPTLYFRHRFVLPSGVSYTNLVLRLAQEHGSVVWLNGRELWRTNLPAGPINYTNLALTKPASTDVPYVASPVAVDPGELVAGTNVIAVEVHQYSASYPAAGFDLELIGTGAVESAPSLEAAVVGGDIVFSWATNGAVGYALYSTASLAAGGWLPASGVATTNGDRLVVTQAMSAGTHFFRLEKQ